MLRIKCPYCGVRDQTEFQFGGEAPIKRPLDPEQVSDQEWAEYLFYRENRKGLHQERWVHVYGCRRWFHVMRDTVSHAIVASCPIDQDPASQLPGDADG